MTNIEKRNEERANEIVNRFMEKGAVVSKSDYDFVFERLQKSNEELIEELRNN